MAKEELYIKIYRHRFGPTFEIYRGNLLYAVASTMDEANELKQEAKLWRR